MKSFQTLFLLPLLAAPLLAQTTVGGSVSNPAVTVTIPAGTFERPLSFSGGLSRNGDLITCTGCGSGGGGGTSGPGLAPWNPDVSTPPVLSTWSQINGGNNGTFANVRNGVLINSVSGNTLKVLQRSAPTGAWTATAHLSATCPANGQFPSYGITISDASGKTITAGYQGDQIPQLTRWTNSSSWNSTPFNGQKLGTPDAWFRVVYDGTLLNFGVSATGADSASFMNQYSEGAGNFLGSLANLGVYASSQNSGLPCIVTLGYWSVTQP